MSNQLRIKQLLADGNLNFTGGGFRVTNMLDPIAAQDAATKSYVDFVASGVNSHPAVKTATDVALSTLGTGFAYANTPNNGRFTWTSGPTSVGGHNLTVGDRILVKNQTGGSPSEAVQNGIYVVTSLNQWDRAADQDGSPLSEAGPGDLVFVETGTYAGTSWILLGVGEFLTLNVDDIIWTQYASAGVYTASNGITKVGYDFQLDLNGLTSTTITGNDTLPFYDISGSTEGKTTLNDLITAANLVVSTANGVLVQTAANTFASRTITGTSNRITLTDGNGVAGNPTVDIASTYVGQTSITTLGVVTTGTWDATTIAVNHGGTGATSLTANGILIGNGTSAITSTVLTNGQLLIGSTGNAPVAANITGVTNEIVVTNGAGSIQLGISPNYDGGTAIVTVGTITSGTWNGTAVGPIYGGTGQSAVATGDILYGSATNVWSRLAAGTAGQVLTISGGIPVWSDSAGDITAVTAGAGLTGGGTSGAVTLDIVAATGGAITVNANDIQVNVDATTIEVNGSNNLAIKDAAITANLLAAALAPRTGLGNGTAGQMLTGNGDGTFGWTDVVSAKINAYVKQVSENASDINNNNGGGVIAYVVAITDVFGTNSPYTGFEPQISVNGLMTGLGNTTSDALYLSTDGGATAVSFASATGVEDLIFNAAAAGYDVDTADFFRVWFQH